MHIRVIFYTVLGIVLVILALELSLTTNIATHYDDISITNNKAATHRSNIETQVMHESITIDITSFMESDTTNKEWMKYLQTKHTNKPFECNNQHWMDGLYQMYEPLNKWSFYDDIAIIRYKTWTKRERFRNKTIILIMDDEKDINHNEYNISDLSTFKTWVNLGESSLLIRRIYNVNDIDLIGRFIEYLWAKNWMGHIRNDPRCTPENDHCRDTHLNPVIVEGVSCWKCGCIVEKQTLNKDKWIPIIENTTFYDIARETMTDKKDFHFYHKLYGKHLESYYYKNIGVFLEIGLGCNMAYGPGESAKIWTKLFNNIEFIEYDTNCSNKYSHLFENNGYLVHIGSQDDVVFLEELKEIYWNEIGLDIIVDDGGHWNKHIITSFLSLWPVLNDNGLYFIEDFQESAYIIDYLDSKPITYWGQEKPGTAQYFIKKQLLYQLFCGITHRSCNDLIYIECIRDMCVLKKHIFIT